MREVQTVSVLGLLSLETVSIPDPVTEKILKDISSNTEVGVSVTTTVRVLFEGRRGSFDSRRVLLKNGEVFEERNLFIVDRVLFDFKKVDPERVYISIL